MSNENNSAPETATGGFYHHLLNNLPTAISMLDVDLRVIFWNAGLEELTGFSREEVEGKPCPKNILIAYAEDHIEVCGEDCPLRHAIRDGAVRSHQAYLQHKQGHRLPVDLRIIPLRSGDDEIIAVLECYTERSPRVSLPQKKPDLEKMNLLDSLTEIANRQYIEIHIQNRLEEMKQTKIPFGILFIDVLDMRTVNATYGNEVGDRILKTLAKTLEKNIRFFDVAGRWGGEEFMTVLLNLDKNKLDVVTNKLRLLVEQTNIRVEDRIIRPETTVGSSMARENDTAESLVKRAIERAAESKK